jgi:D-alanyl-D-alanine carboxypeptidase
MKGQNVLSPETVKLMQTGNGNTFFPSYRLGTILFHNLGYGHNGERTGYLSLMAYDPLTDVSVVAFISLVDKTQGVNGDDSFKKTFLSIYHAAWDARAALGYPGRP